MKRFLVTTTPLLDGIKINEYLGVVNANIVIGANVIADFAASFTDFFGGNSGSYQRRMNEMYESAIKELKRKTMLLGCWLCSCHHHIDNNRYKRFHL